MSSSLDSAGVTPAQETQLRAAITQDAHLLQQLNQDAASGQLKGFALPQAGAASNLAGTYELASGVAKIVVRMVGAGAGMATEKTSGERVERIVTGLIRHMPALVLGIATTACAHTSSPTSPPKEPAVMNAPAADAYRPHTLAEYPELTPEEIGRRFLKLIDSLKSFDKLTLEHLQKVMRLQLAPAPETHSAFFNMYLPDSEWYYRVTYFVDAQSHQAKGAAYQFINDKSGLADMAPVCGLDFDAYLAALREMGFEERAGLDQYYLDSQLPSLFHTFTFTRNDIKLHIRLRSEADTSNEKFNHNCVESIDISRLSHG